MWCWHLRQDICPDLKASKSQHPASWMSKKTFDCQLTFNVYPCLSQQGPLRRRNSRDPWAVLPLLSLRAERCMKTKPDPCCLHLLTCFRQSLQTFRCKSTETDWYNFIDKPYTALPFVKHLVKSMCCNWWQQELRTAREDAARKREELQHLNQVLCQDVSDVMSQMYTNVTCLCLDM